MRARAPYAISLRISLDIAAIRNAVVTSGNLQVTRTSRDEIPRFGDSEIRFELLARLDRETRKQMPVEISREHRTVVEGNQRASVALF